MRSPRTLPYETAAMNVGTTSRLGRQPASRSVAARPPIARPTAAAKPPIKPAAKPAPIAPIVNRAQYGSGDAHYWEIDAIHVRDFLRGVALATADAASAELGLPPLHVHYFVDAKDRRRLTPGAREFRAAPGVAGFTLVGEWSRDLFVNVCGRRERPIDLAKVVAHEARHLARGKGEQDADAYAESLVQRIATRQWWTSSQLAAARGH